MRAHQIVTALSAEWKVDVLSWLPDVESSAVTSLWSRGPVGMARVVSRALARAWTMPLQVAYVQSLAPRSLRRAFDDYEAVVFVTDRAVPPVTPPGLVVDFVDDLGAAALRKAESSQGVRALFWRWEGERLKRLDRRLARGSLRCVASSRADAETISEGVRVIPNYVERAEVAGEGDKVVFAGNLFYPPNHDAAIWICRELVPCLVGRGLHPETIVIAGRRPLASVRQAATAAGVDLRPDLPDLAQTLQEAAVILAPILMGSGIQNKVLEAVGVGRPCVLTPEANAGIGLVDGQSAVIRERHPELFADAVVTLLGEADTRRRLVRQARARLAPYMPDSVSASWRALMAEAIVDGPVG